MASPDGHGILHGERFQVCEITECYLVGGFNPSENYESKWESSPNRGEHRKYLKPPPSYDFNELQVTFIKINQNQYHCISTYSEDSEQKLL